MDAQALRVLIVEDQPADAELMLLSLAEEGLEFEHRVIRSEAELRESLAWPPDIVLSDWNLPGFGGLEGLEIVRGHDPLLPFLIVSGGIGEEAAVDTLHRGADDFVMKDRLGRLGPAVRRALDLRRAREEEQRAAKDLAFQAIILANVRDSIIVTDARGLITYWNAGATGIYGWTAEEMLGRHVSETSATPPDEIGAALRDIGAGHDFAGIWPMRHRSGRTVWADVRTDTVRDIEGRLTGFIGVSRDVTEQRQAALERERLATAIEHAAEAVVLTDASANITYVNPAYERLTGYAAREVMGQNPRILNSGSQPVALYESMWQTLTQCRPWTGELVNKRKDGELFTVQETISPVKDADGELAGYVGVLHDVTRERALEQEAARMAREHAVVAESLASLQAQDTPERTAEVVCRNIAGLAGIAAVGILAFEHDHGAIALALVEADGTSHPLLRLPADRGAYLWRRASDGFWVESWKAAPDHPYAATMGAMGARALSGFPIRHAGNVVGFLTAVSAERDAMTILADSLPALAEYADLVSALLGPAMAERTMQGARHDRVARTLTERAFHPVYQPIVDLATGQVVGFEALTRFSAGERPDLLFADAWAVGLGPEMEMAVLGAALEGAAGLPGDPWLDVNVSPSLLVGADGIARLLGGYPRQLVIEVTEHESVSDYAALRDVVRRLGPEVRLAVDDAGAGTANFAHIVELRPDFVKLDMGLVRGLDRDLGRQALVVGMRHFARASGCRLVAEGIETQAEADTARALDVEYGQGEFFGAPRPVADWATGAG